MFLFYFLPITLVFYYLLVSMKVKLSWVNLFVTVMSYIFYGWYEPWFVGLMLLTSSIDFAMGKIISRPGATKAQRNAALTFSCIADLSLLGFFKYYMFFMGGMNKLVEIFGGGSNAFHILNITLPIGISFYTFQSLSYTIDVWRKDAPPVKDFPTYTCFVALFPQLIAGPIVRYNTVAEQLSYRKHSLEMFANGTTLFMLGFVKKILLANAGGEVADLAFGADSLSTGAAWWGALGYHFQIYFDFCAYSDMAVGLGRMMGFEFIKNFDAPYRAVSMTDFWRRWHISLSTWIRDNLYISLGGNRKGVGRTYFNLAISMFLCGMWHGAKMTFIIWGVMTGGMLILERLMGRDSFYGRLPTIPKIIITNVIVMFAWVVFRSPDIGQAAHFWGAMVGLGRPLPSVELLHAQLFSPRHLIEMTVCGFLVWQPLQAHVWVDKLKPYKFVVAAVLFIIAIVGMFSQSYNPFLYFQF